MRFNNNIIIAICILIILLPLGYSLAYSAFSAIRPQAEPFLQKPDEQCGQRCVLETEYGINARFHHMDFLKRLRDEAVREGKRGDMGLDNCWECHANSERGTSREGFCDQCHGAVNLRVGCFECHYDPDVSVETGH